MNLFKNELCVVLKALCNYQNNTHFDPNSMRDKWEAERLESAIQKLSKAYDDKSGEFNLRIVEREQNEGR